MPLLIEPQSPTPGADPVGDELERLGAVTVLGVGAVSDHPGRDVVGVPANAAELERVTGLRFGSADPVAPGAEASAVARLEPGSPVALLPEGGAAAAVPEDAAAGPVPEVSRAEALGDTVVLATGGPESLAGIATARAAGARVLLTGGATDPRASADLVAALSEGPAEKVVALGPAFAAEEGLDWKISDRGRRGRTARRGSAALPGRLLVALYGQPGTPALGVLGEQGRRRASSGPGITPPRTSRWSTAVVPTFEIIATVASAGPGPDRNYSDEADPEVLRPWVEAAGEAGMYVVLDLQPGRTDFRTQAERYRSLLELPHVGLALDPEWRLGADEVHLRQIGSVGIDEVNGVVTWLADLTRRRRCRRSCWSSTSSAWRWSTAGIAWTPRARSWR